MTTTCDVGNADPGLGQAQVYGGVKLVDGIKKFVNLLFFYCMQ
jgi:hypothetical protein